jgi:hypothetical protein
MRKILCLAALIAVVSGCSFRHEWSHTSQSVRTAFKGVTYTAELDSDAEDTVRVYTDPSSGRREIWRGIPKSLKPWKVLLGDVDGDGQLDLGVGVYKKSEFHPVMAKRPFIYSWDGKRMSPKWRGSRLSRPFTDFVFAAFPGGPKLVAIEDTEDGQHEIAVYKWDGFGFTREWTGCRAKRLTGLTADGTAVSVMSDRSDKSYIWNGKALEEAER